MRSPEIRRLAKTHDTAALEAARSALMEGDPLPFEVEGEDDGERLTHVNLALRITRRMDEGVDLKDAFREVIGDVRRLLS